MKSRRKPGGIAHLIDPELPNGEIIQETFTCRHCNSVKIIPLGKKVDEISGGCWHCWGLICLNCVRDGICKPFIKEVEEAEERFYRQKQYEMLGLR